MMKNQQALYACILILCSFYRHIEGSTQKRIRFTFINNAPEDVYVAIGNQPLKAIDKYLVALNEKKYHFPIEFNSEKPLYITLSSMSYELQYTLQLQGSFDRSRIRACHAYGDIILMRGPHVVQTIGATNLESGLILRYTPEFELEITHITSKERAHKPQLKSCHPPF